MVIIDVTLVCVVNIDEILVCVCGDVSSDIDACVVTFVVNMDVI